MKRNDDFEFDQVVEIDVNIVSITKDLMLQGRMERLEFLKSNDDANGYYLEHLWVLGELFQYQASNLSVQYLRVPIGTTLITTTNRTKLIGLNGICEQNEKNGNRFRLEFANIDR